MRFQLLSKSLLRSLKSYQRKLKIFQKSKKRMFQNNKKIHRLKKKVIKVKRNQNQRKNPEMLQLPLVRTLHQKMMKATVVEEEE